MADVYLSGTPSRPAARYHPVVMRVGTAQVPTPPSSCRRVELTGAISFDALRTLTNHEARRRTCGGCSTFTELVLTGASRLGRKRHRSRHVCVWRRFGQHCDHNLHHKLARCTQGRGRDAFCEHACAKDLVSVGQRSSAWEWSRCGRSE